MGKKSGDDEKMEGEDPSDEADSSQKKKKKKKTKKSKKDKNDEETTPDELQNDSGCEQTEQKARKKKRFLLMTMIMNHPSENRLKTTWMKKNRPERKAKKKRNKTPRTPTTPSPPPTKNYPDSEARISWLSRDTEQKNNIFNNFYLEFL